MHLILHRAACCADIMEIIPIGRTEGQTCFAAGTAHEKIDNQKRISERTKINCAGLIGPPLETIKCQSSHHERIHILRTLRDFILICFRQNIFSLSPDIQYRLNAPSLSLSPKVSLGFRFCNFSSNVWEIENGSREEMEEKVDEEEVSCADIAGFAFNCEYFRVGGANGKNQ